MSESVRGFAALVPSDPCLRCQRCAGCHAPHGDCPVPNTSCATGTCPQEPGPAAPRPDPMKPEKRPRDGWPLRERQEQPAAAGQLGADQALLIFAGLVANWSQRVNCPQCGNRYDATACGPTHVLVGFHIQAAREIADA